MNAKIDSKANQPYKQVRDSASYHKKDIKLFGLEYTKIEKSFVNISICEGKIF
jgi:hypothetical protein